MLTGIALKTQDSSDTVEVQLAPADSIGDIGLDVIVNSEHINLTGDSMYWQDFRGKLYHSLLLIILMKSSEMLLDLVKILLHKRVRLSTY